MPKRYDYYQGEAFSYYISDEFDGNHILHMTSSKRGELEVWWYRRSPTAEEMYNLYNRWRGE